MRLLRLYNVGGLPPRESLSMKGIHRQLGQANLTSVLLLVGLLVAAVWTWKSLDYDSQDIIVEDVVPIAAAILVAVVAGALVIRKVQRYRGWRFQRERLLKQFEQETSPEARLDLAFSLVELNHYYVKGIESAIPTMAEMFKRTLTTALGDKQHRIRGMAASHLGAIQDRTSIPLLLKALEDDHAYVRSSAALSLGRMRVLEAKEKLSHVMKEDWDQTTRSRAREALERIT